MHRYLTDKTTRYFRGGEAGLDATLSPSGSTHERWAALVAHRALGAAITSALMEGAAERGAIPS